MIKKILNNGKVIRQIILSILIFAVSGAFYGCSNTPSCLNQGMQRVSINWGTIIKNESNKSVTINGYILNHKAQVKDYTKLNDSVIFETDFLDLDEELFCRTVGFVRKQLAATQALYEPADTQRFVYYKNPKYNLDLRIVYSPRFKTPGSVKVRKAWDSLSVLLNSLEKE